MFKVCENTRLISQELNIHMQIHVIANYPIAGGSKLVPEKSEFFPADLSIELKSIFHIPFIV